MLKQILSFFIIIALSALVVFFMPESQKAVQTLVTAHDWITDLLTKVFNGDFAGNIARDLTALLCIPLIAGLIPAILFFVVRKRWLNCFMEIVWFVWLAQTGALLMKYAQPSENIPPVMTKPAKPAVTIPAVEKPATPTPETPKPAEATEAVSPAAAAADQTDSSSPAPEPLPQPEQPQ